MSFHVCTRMVWEKGEMKKSTTRRPRLNIRFSFGITVYRYYDPTYVIHSIEYPFLDGSRTYYTVRQTDGHVLAVDYAHYMCILITPSPTRQLIPPRWPT